MKILYMVSVFPKLSETFILNQITTFIDNGDDVTILAESNPNEQTTHQLVTKYNLLSKTIYYKLPEEKINRILSALFCSIIILFSRPKQFQRLFNFNLYGADAYSLRHIFATYTLRNDVGEFDAVICHFGPNGNLAAMLRHIGCIKGKLVTIFHGYDMTSYVKQKGKGVYSFLFSVGDMFLPISDYWKTELISLGCAGSKILTHHMGVDTGKFKFNYVPLNKTELKLISVARLIEKKGIEYVLGAISLLRISGQNVKYTIIGEGPLKKALEMQSKDMGLESDVTFLGPQIQQNVINAINNADIFILPSIVAADGDMEGIPVVLMESMAMGKVTVSSYHSGIIELIENGQNGFLGKERDQIGIAELIRTITDTDDDILRNICTNARKKVESDFEIYKLNKELSIIIKNLADNKENYL